ncbi:deoxyribonuclease-2-alpha-like [Carcharodon carcharias]|uniref:deoxyribonuclease-2-alpha-like n=1 Tax=Carcharodon carcharias TaxID=13397 RepID=UPI001B7F715A|nr:deoxyribonuclease-2-alpha-like [Carcharodon carcharias]XP_041033348.1 deoxyribonuclease-2-alpha-like [Carcharodon carcharias]XP_041033349.1 deoxyribonuclease-2-alpha-like [Carcharodon carcharias]
MLHSDCWHVLASLTVACFASFVTSDISCYNDDGQPVDWFIIYKLPKIVSGSGLTYMYMDPSKSGWTAGKYPISDTKGAVGGTLQQLYKGAKSQSDNVAYVLYNDQSGNLSNSRVGHTKGVVLLDQKQGFWLVHSTPHFPPRANKKYWWPESGLKNGQSFLCVTYQFSRFKDIGTQLLYNNPHVYDHSLPPPFDKDLVNLTKAATGELLESPPWSREIILPSAAGKRFISFAKYSKFGDDLYSGWVADFFHSDLLVETWQNSAHTLPSNCSRSYAVYNVKTITFPTDISFSCHVDHSKWCVTRPGGDVKWTCIGDINRDEAQEHRGGGTVCTDDPVVWHSFLSLVSSCQSCPCCGSEKGRS